MTKYYIKSYTGLLKNVLPFASNGWFSQQHGLAIQFNSAADAETYRIKALDSAKQNLSDARIKLNASQHLVTNWDNYKFEERNLYSKNNFLSMVYCDNKHNYIHSTWAGFAKYKNDFIRLINIVKAIESAEVITEIAKVHFYPKQKGTIKWTDKRVYCIGCGGVVTDVKYIEFKGTKLKQVVHLCPFCISKLAKEVENIVENIPEEVKKQYKTDRFLGAL